MKYILTTILFIGIAASFAQVDAISHNRANQTIQLFTGEHPHISNNITLRSAGDILISDDFSDLSNWTIYTDEGTAPVWEWTTETPMGLLDYIGSMNSTTHSNGFAVFNGAQHLLDGYVPLQNTLLEYNPIIDCSELSTVIISFEQRYRSFNTDSTYLEISNNGGITYDYSFEINKNSPVNSLTTQSTERLNITAIAAGVSEIKVRFRWIESSENITYGSGYGWMIDDFSISEAWDYDQRLTETYMRTGIGGYMPNGLDYYQIPVDQFSEFSFSGKSKNMSGIAQINAKINVQITGPTLYESTSTPFVLEENSTDSVYCEDPFITELLGLYNTKHWVDSDNPEQYTANDTILSSFIINYTNGIYARDNGNATGYIDNVTANFGAPFLIGNVMEAYAVMRFNAMYIDITDAPSNIGKMVYAQIMKLDTTLNKFIYIDQTGDHTISAGQLGGTVSLYLGERICFNTGDVFLILAGNYGELNAVQFKIAQNVVEQSVLGYISGAENPFYLKNPQAIMIRIKNDELYGEGCDVGVKQYKNNKFIIEQNIPNPFKNNTVINYELNEATNVSAEFVDITGKIVKTINNGTQETGTYTLNIDANEFAEGIYFYTFTVGTESRTKKMIVSK